MLPGFDVSHYQGTVDFKLAAKSEKFVFVKSTDGAENVDPFVKVNLSKATDAGLYLGAYHFYRPLEDTPAQADNFCMKVKGFKVLPALDIEPTASEKNPDESWNDFPIENRILEALQWLQLVERNLGRTPILYATRYFLDTFIGKFDALGKYPLWIAHYAPTPGPIPSPWNSWSFWQYSETGAVPGVNGNVDQDWFLGGEDDLKALYD